MEKDWIFSQGDHACGVRTAGVLIRDGKILVQRESSGNEFALPGGHLRIGETLEEALVREYREETGAEIRCVKMLWSEECFWEWNGRKTHNLSFYYLIELVNEHDLPDTGEFVPHRDNARVVVGWMPVEDVENAQIYPEFLKREISDLSGPIKHFVSRG